MSHNVFRDGTVHVCKEMCDTCIFRPGNLMQLHEGRVEQMIEEATADESCIPCHKTLDGDNAVCAGFFKKHRTQPLQIAERLKLVTYIELED